MRPATPANMLYPQDGSAFDMLARFIEHEYADPADMEMRGMLAALGIEKGKPFNPDARTRELLDKGAKTALPHGHAIIYEPLAIVPNALWWKDRRWGNVFPGNATFTAPTFNYIDPRTGFFASPIPTSPGMAVNMVNVGAKYPVTFVDADGEFLRGGTGTNSTCPRTSRGAVLVGDGLRSGHRLGARQRPAVPLAQHNGQARDQRRRIHRLLLRSELAGRGQELAANAPRPGLLCDPAPVRTHEGFLRQGVEAERHTEASLAPRPPHDFH